MVYSSIYPGERHLSSGSSAGTWSPALVWAATPGVGRRTGEAQRPSVSQGVQDKGEVWGKYICSVDRRLSSCSSAGIWSPALVWAADKGVGRRAGEAQASEQLVTNPKTETGRIISAWTFSKWPSEEKRSLAYFLRASYTHW
jgi:hypothetical protein